MKTITKEVLTTFIGASIGNFMYYFLLSDNLNISDLLAIELGLSSMSVALIVIFKIKKIDVKTHDTTK